MHTTKLAIQNLKPIRCALDTRSAPTATLILMKGYETTEIQKNTFKLNETPVFKTPLGYNQFSNVSYLASNPIATYTTRTINLSSIPSAILLQASNNEEFEESAAQEDVYGGFAEDGEMEREEKEMKKEDEDDNDDDNNDGGVLMPVFEWVGGLIPKLAGAVAI